jgi:hypothetical protein
MVYPYYFGLFAQKGGSTMKANFKTALVYSKKFAKGLLILAEALEKLTRL